MFIYHSNIARSLHFIIGFIESWNRAASTATQLAWVSLATDPCQQPVCVTSAKRPITTLQYIATTIKV
jgi:hypothetical protein